MPENLKSRFFRHICDTLNSDACRVNCSDSSADEERVERRYAFKLKETLLICGASNVDIHLVQEDGYSKIRAIAFDDENQHTFEFRQRRQSTWKEYYELAEKTITEVICFAELCTGDDRQAKSSLKWESIIENGAPYSFGGEVQIWTPDSDFSPICHDWSRIKDLTIAAKEKDKRDSIVTYGYLSLFLITIACLASFISYAIMDELGWTPGIIGVVLILFLSYRIYRVFALIHF